MENEKDSSGVTISEFDYSVDNHFKAMDTIFKLCKEGEEEMDANEKQRWLSNITFLREWRHYYYKPRVIRFSSEIEGRQGKNVVDGVKLTQFSAANIPKVENLLADAKNSGTSKDFVLYVGGHVWGLDWCPNVQQRSENQINCEYLAVAAHSPGSSYHKIGVPLAGRGVVQIWCLLNVNTKEETPKLQKKLGQKKLGRPRKKIQEGRGRPRKKDIKDTLSDLSREDHSIEAIAGQLDDVMEKESPTLKKSGESSREKQDIKKHSDGIDRDGHFVPPLAIEFLEKSSSLPATTGVSPHLSSQDEDKESYAESMQGSTFFGQDAMTACQKIGKSGIITSTSYLPEDVAFPRMVLCLAHNGRVTWDVKWRPSNGDDSEHKHRMGYLAVLLGNGSLEVWEVPSPSAIKILYSYKKDGTDPRFVKLEPVFRCSKLKCGDRQSIPLTMEWSPSSPHDLILAGCHDGTVALWKFSASGSCQDTRPLLCFSADTVPIRALAWAPDESDSESENLIVIAGHGNVRFWDIRDPYRPLWELLPVRRMVYSLDWLPDLRCVIISFDDGTLKILSLVKAANDVPVTGKPFGGTQQQGLHTYTCSSFPIWSVQASRLTGFVAYCSSDGSALHFQLTRKAVDKDPSRNRTPHFLCGSLTEEDATLTVNTSLSNIPVEVPLKKTINECGDTPRSRNSFLSDLYQAERANDESPDHEILALCYGDGPSMDMASGDILNAPKVKTTPRLSKKGKLDPSLACSSQGDFDKNQEESRTEVESLPPKIVAMHRVRWNMNKGSERWLCFGGTAGIVRCQKIATPFIGEHLQVNNAKPKVQTPKWTKKPEVQNYKGKQLIVSDEENDVWEPLRHVNIDEIQGSKGMVTRQATNNKVDEEEAQETMKEMGEQVTSQNTVLTTKENAKEGDQVRNSEVEESSDSTTVEQANNEGKRGNDIVYANVSYTSAESIQATIGMLKENLGPDWYDKVLQAITLNTLKGCNATTSNTVKRKKARARNTVKGRKATTLNTVEGINTMTPTTVEGSNAMTPSTVEESNAMTTSTVEGSKDTRRSKRIRKASKQYEDELFYTGSPSSSSCLS